MSRQVTEKLSAPGLKKARVFLVAGDEQELCRQALTGVVEAFVPAENRDISVEVMEGENFELRDILSAVGTPPMCGGEKVVVARDLPLLFSADEQNVKKLIAYLKDPLPDFCRLVFHLRRKADGKMKIIKHLRKTAFALEFNSPDEKSVRENVLIKDLNELLAPRGKRIGQRAASALLSRSDYSFTTAAAELLKLAEMVGERSEIMEKDVLEQTYKYSGEKGYNWADAVGGRDKARSLAVFRELWAEGTPALVLNMILINRVRLLIQAKVVAERERDIRPHLNYTFFKNSLWDDIKAGYASVFPSGDGGRYTLTRLHPFVALKLFQDSFRFQYRELFGLYEGLMENDRRLKSGFKPEKILLENIILNHL